MADKDLLQTWKEIAAHLGRSERTCRRWETEFGLPVHRMDGSARGSVFAYRSELDEWIDDILHDGQPTAPPARRLTARWVLSVIVILVVVAAVVVVVVASRGCRPKPQQAISSTKPTLAILPFTNNTGDESLDFWGNGVADLLVSDLSQSRYLKVLPQETLFGVLRDLDLLDAGDAHPIDLEKVAARAQVENIVVGRFIKAGQRYRISATVHHMPSGEGTALPNVEARSEEEILLKIDTLSTRIKTQLLSSANIAGRDIDYDAGSITTSSIEAYKYYLEGRLSYFRGSRLDAMESLEMAVKIDPEFAMAHNYLAMCYRSFPGYNDEAEEAMTRAFELSHHASPRERFFIQAIYHRAGGRRSWGRYLETCQEFAKVYPDDFRAHFALGEIYCRIEEWDKCVDALKNVEGGDFPSPPFLYLQRAYSALGKYDEALAHVRASPAGIDSLEYRNQLALNLVHERRFEAALDVADTMLERSPGYVRALKIRGDIHFLRAEWDQAEANYRDLLNPVVRESSRLRYRLEAMHRLVNLYLAKGQYEQALEVVREAIEEVTAVAEEQWLLSFHYRMATILRARGDLAGAEAETRWALEEAERRDHVTGTIAALDLHGMILLETGNLGEADRAADQMKGEIDGWLNPKLMRNWYHLAGHIALARGDVDQAVEHFQQAVSLLPYQYDVNGDEHAMYYSSLAYAYYVSGDLTTAQQWYENILALTSGRLRFGDIYARSHFMLGKIYEQRGMRAAATQSYRTFLELWREDDRREAELEQARHALEVLLN